MKSEIAVYTPHGYTELVEFAKKIAATDMVPNDFKRKPDECLIAMMMGGEVGLNPIQSLQNISVINGRPAIWGDAMLALVLNHPKCEDIQEEFDEATQTATCTVMRKGHAPRVSTFSKEDAEKAKLWGKQGPWSQYPKRMLQIRARSWAIRDKFSDALKGLYSAEEARDIIDITPRPPLRDFPDTPFNAQTSSPPPETTLDGDKSGEGESDGGGAVPEKKPRGRPRKDASQGADKGTSGVPIHPDIPEGMVEAGKSAAGIYKAYEAGVAPADYWSETGQHIYRGAVPEKKPRGRPRKDASQGADKGTSGVPIHPDIPEGMVEAGKFADGIYKAYEEGVAPADYWSETGQHIYRGADPDNHRLIEQVRDYWKAELARTQ